MSLDIQRILEDAIPEVEDLVDRGLLSKDEIGAIMSKRREFETRLHRFEALKTDFLQYIEYELNLDKLISKRKQRLNIKRKGPGDVASLKRINFIFDRALRKFQGDLDLWVAAIEFAQLKHSTSRVSKLVGQAIRLFPQNEGFWILAASHEFESNKNVAEARAVMMQALRVNPKSQALWVEYFKLEFLFLHRVLERRGILGLETSEEEPIVRGDVLKIIYRKAVESIDESIEFRLRFVRECEVFASGSCTNVAKSLIEYCLQDIKKTFSDRHAVVWIELAKHASSESEAESILSCASEDHPTAELFEYLIIRELKSAAYSKVKELCQKASRKALLSERSAVAWAEAVSPSPIHPRKRTRRSIHSEEDADDVQDTDALLRTLTDRFPYSSRLWILRCERDEKAIEDAVRSLDGVDSLPFWEKLIAKDEKQLYKALATLSRQTNCEPLIVALVAKALEQADSPSALVRDLEKKAINLVPLQSFLSVLTREETSKTEKRRLFEQCVDRYPNNAELWKEYIRFETSEKKAKQVHDITLRAIAAVPQLKWDQELSQRT